MDLIAHPFRLASDGSVATVDQDSDEDYGQQLAVILLTRKAERELVPSFGISEPAYLDLNLAELNVVLADYGPPIRVGVIDKAYPAEDLETITLTYTAEARA